MEKSNLLLGLVMCVSVPAITSCVDSSFLDETQITDLSKEVIFSDSTYTVGFLNHIYTDVGFDIYPNRFDGGLFDAGEGGLQTACDESEFMVTSHNTDGVQFVTGTVNPLTISEKTWRTCYNQIRATNVFLAEVDACPMDERARVRYKAEARFLRAWYYFILLRHYGGVPLLGDEVYTNENFESINMTRATFKECVDYIVSECNEALTDLPTRRAGSAFGRASAGACMGLISRTLLYAASDLYNGTDLTTDERLKAVVGYPERDDERWLEAFNAARRLIATGAYQVFIKHEDDSGNPEPGWGFYAQFEATDFWNQNSGGGYTYVDGAACSSIFMQIHGMGTEKENLFDPPTCNTSDGKGKGGYPTHDFAECFPMLDGATPGQGKYTYDRMNPSQNRDPRFANTLIWHGSKRRSQNTEWQDVFTHQGLDATNDAIYQATRTGYYWRKFSHRATSGGYIQGCPQIFHLMRYEEVLLNYAEAANRYYGPQFSEVVEGITLGPLEVLKKLRERAGIEPGEDGNYGLDPNMTQTQMEEAIRLERRIELSLEGHRFFDVRRWKIAETTENQMAHGFEVTKKIDGTYSYRIVNVRQHVFRPAMYLWPIPYNEVTRSDKLIQNPYYE